MKTFLEVIGAAIFGFILVTVAILATQVPEVYLENNKDLGPSGQVETWMVEKIVDHKGREIPRDQWSSTLKGRYRISGL